MDSSTDGTGDLVRQGYPEVRLITSTCPALLRVDARNLGLKIARAPIIAFLDADCFVEPGWVDAVLGAQRPPHLPGLRRRPERQPGPPGGLGLLFLRVQPLAARRGSPGNP